eukprot:7503972-Ditylum_brightwellii.AAC.1
MARHRPFQSHLNYSGQQQPWFIILVISAMTIMGSLTRTTTPLSPFYAFAFQTTRRYVASPSMQEIPKRYTHATTVNMMMATNAARRIIPTTMIHSRQQRQSQPFSLWHPKATMSNSRMFLSTKGGNPTAITSTGEEEKEEVEKNSYSLQLSIPTSEDMEDVGAIISMGTKGGDTILLDGDLGAGKTCFSRGFVRARTGYIDLRVTSPTYLLSNTYEADDGNT